MNAKEYITPSVVLVLICLVITGALAITYQMTEPVIAAINEKNANEARAVVLPSGADGGFSAQEGNFVDGVKEVFAANNGTGIAYTSEDKGFGGSLTVMTGVDDQGKITGVKVTKHTETPGLGTKAMTVEYLEQYIGQSAITRSGAADKTQIDAVTGATVTSDAVFRAVEKALAQDGKGGAQ
ncbi:MAG: RnfABCDGE type electron transport complex subunit G [Anaerovoracaceae bacterium]|jgi:electron transport complex protein RnfG